MHQWRLLHTTWILLLHDARVETYFKLIAMALRGYGPMSGTPGKTWKKQKRRETQTSGGRLLDRYPSIQLSVVGEQLLATLAVRKRPCRPRIGYRLCTDALLVTEKVPAAWAAHQLTYCQKNTNASISKLFYLRSSEIPNLIAIFGAKMDF